jgi:hypothetical protein
MSNRRLLVEEIARRQYFSHVHASGRRVSLPKRPPTAEAHSCHGGEQRTCWPLETGRLRSDGVAADIQRGSW